MRRQIVLGVLPLAVVGFVVGYVRMVAGERRVRRAGGAPTPPRVWWWAFGVGFVALAAGALVAWLSGLAHHSGDQLRSALTGSFMLAPGLVVGLCIGVGRWLGSRTVWRSRAKGLR